MKLDNAYQIFSEIRGSISRFEDSWGYLPDEFEYNSDDVEEKYNHDIAISVVNRLDDVQRLLKWVESPIVLEGRLTKNSYERYEVDGKELTSGYPLDAWDDELEEWINTSVEHNGRDYYIVSFGRDRKIEGVLVRLRK